MCATSPGPSCAPVASTGSCAPPARAPAHWYALRNPSSFTDQAGVLTTGTLPHGFDRAREGAHDPRGRADRDGVVGHVVEHDRVRPDDRAAADPHTRAYDDVLPEPRTVADLHGPHVAQ